MSSLITVDKITKTFKKDLFAASFTALDDVSFSLGEGETIGFLGANGAGKTTSLKIIFDFITPDSGSVKFGEVLGGNLKSALNKIGYLPERPYFYPHLTGRQFLEFMGKLNGIKSERLDVQIEKYAERFKIKAALGRHVRDYSKGMLQRLGFASVLIHEPELLILDEPLSGLDPIGRKEFKDVIIELAEDGKTVFFSSHIVSDIEEVCSKVIVLESGKVVYNGRIDELISENTKEGYEILVSGAIDEKAVRELNLTKKTDSLFVISRENKNIALAALVERGVTIEALRPLTSSLEQIIYKIRND
jgi:ABC-2 type transport system ATP-binding protein